MKKILFSLTLLLFVIESFGQTEASRTASKDYYLQKSKNQKTVGWVMLGGGVAMTTIGLIIQNKKINNDPINAFLEIADGSVQGSTILMLAGIGTAIGSIPFFINSKKYARRAAALSFNNQKVRFPRQNNFVFKMQPALTLKIAL